MERPSQRTRDFIGPGLSLMLYGRLFASCTWNLFYNPVLISKNAPFMQVVPWLYVLAIVGCGFSIIWFMRVWRKYHKGSNFLRTA
jgi:hypothetical protein